MNIEIHFLEILKLAAMLIGAAWVLLEINARQFSKRIDEKFGGIEQSRKEAGDHWDMRYGKTEAAVVELSNRITTMETEMKHKPSHAEMRELNMAVSAVRGQNETQTQLLQRMDRQLNLINEWMMENK